MKLRKNTNIRPPETKMTIGTRMAKAKPGTKIRQQREQKFELETKASSGSQINATKLGPQSRNVTRNRNDNGLKLEAGTRMEIGTRQPDEFEEEIEYLSTRNQNGNQMKLRKNTNICPPETKMTIGTRMEKAKTGTKIRQEREQKFELETKASSGSQINATKLGPQSRNVTWNRNDNGLKLGAGTRMLIGTRQPDEIEEE